MAALRSARPERRLWRPLRFGDDWPRASWFAVAGGPVAWFASFMMILFLAQGGCDSGAGTARAITLGVASLIVLAALLLAIFNFRATGDAAPVDNAEVGMRRTAALWGLIVGLLSVLLMAALIATSLTLDPCIRDTLGTVISW